MPPIRTERFTRHALRHTQYHATRDPNVPTVRGSWPRGLRSPDPGPTEVVESDPKERSMSKAQEGMCSNHEALDDRTSTLDEAGSSTERENQGFDTQHVQDHEEAVESPKKHCEPNTGGSEALHVDAGATIDGIGEATKQYDLYPICGRCRKPLEEGLLLTECKCVSSCLEAVGRC
jgi:hypothetical protein